MPGGDRSGPDGRGPRGGACVGRGFGFGIGRFFRRRSGMGFRRGFAGVFLASEVSERELLESRTKDLERELAILKNRLQDTPEKSDI